MLKIEICCCSVDDAVQAYHGGADRVELNSCLEAGGLTPSIGSLEVAKQKIEIPIIAMVRPRTGGFCYTHLEFEAMKRDTYALLQAGADGIAVGILKENGMIDTARMKEILEICHSFHKEAVCHRAIDVTPDPIVAAQTVAELGFDRILSSGGKQRCIEGIQTLNEMYKCLGTKIEILACGSIRPNNLAQIISQTDIHQFHMSLTSTIHDTSMENKDIQFNGVSYESDYKQIDCHIVREAVKIGREQFHQFCKKY